MPICSEIELVLQMIYWQKRNKRSGLLQETFSNNKFSFRSISPLNRHWRRKARDRGTDAGKHVIES